MNLKPLTRNEVQLTIELCVPSIFKYYFCSLLIVTQHMILYETWYEDHILKVLDNIIVLKYLIILDSLLYQYNTILKTNALEAVLIVFILKIDALRLPLHILVTWVFIAHGISSVHVGLDLFLTIIVNGMIDYPLVIIVCLLMPAYDSCLECFTFINVQNCFAAS